MLDLTEEKENQNDWDDDDAFIENLSKLREQSVQETRRLSNGSQGSQKSIKDIISPSQERVFIEYKFTPIISPCPYS